LSAIDHDDIRRDLLLTTEQLYRLIDPQHTLTCSSLIATARGLAAAQDAVRDTLDAVQNCVDALLDTLPEPALAAA